MGRRLPQALRRTGTKQVRINYWTTAPLEPGIEAISKEVADLAGHFDGRILAVNPHLTLRAERGTRVLGFHPRWDPLLRLAIPLLERRGDLNHVYAEVSPWLFHKTLRRRPIVLTIASEKGEVVPEFLDRCATIVVQTQGMQRSLAQRGVEASRLRLIYPGIDLDRFQPGEGRMPAARPRVLLATFPRTAGEMDERGVSFLLDAAVQLPHIDFSLLSRPWRSGSTAAERTRQIIVERSLANVTLLEGAQADMRELYLRHDFTVIPFTTPEGGKECPRSLVETLACGVPALISAAAPFSTFVSERQCGTVFPLTTQGFAGAVESAVSDYRRLCGNAVRESRATFDIRSMLKAYSDVYETAH